MRSDQALHYLPFNCQIEPISTGSQLDLRNFSYTGPPSAVGNMSGYRCVSDCRSRGREFDPRLVLYFRGD